jgi:hypothetical protein
MRNPSKKDNGSSGCEMGEASGPAAGVRGKSLGKEMPRHFPRAARTRHPNVFIKTFGWPFTN